MSYAHRRLDAYQASEEACHERETTCPGCWHTFKEPAARHERDEAGRHTLTAWSCPHCDQILDEVRYDAQKEASPAPA